MPEQPTNEYPFLQGLLGAAGGGPPGQAFLEALLNVVRAINAQTQAIQVNPYKSYGFATLPASPPIGLVVVVTDSNTNVWGANVAGGGANKVLAWFNSVNWTVIGK